MLVLLRQSETRLYYGVHGEWVSKVSVAAHFQTVEDALLHSRHEHLQSMEVVVFHSNGGHKVVLPVGKQSWAKQHWNTAGSAVHSHTAELRVGGNFPSQMPRRVCHSKPTSRHRGPPEKE
jgi:hypothetical protein